VRLDRGDVAAMLGVLDPGDEVVVFEPFYENKGTCTLQDQS
jgi:aspartate/methionine/tyrosine aminotransferase